MRIIFALLTACTLADLSAQTQIDLRKQAAHVDFASAPATRPWKMGTVPPSSCQTGEVFFNSDAPNGQNVSICVSGGWISYAGTLPSQANSEGFFLRTNGTSAYWSGLATGNTGGLDCVTLLGVCDVVPAVIPFKGLSNVWTGANDFTASPFLKIKSGTGDPAADCVLVNDVGKVYLRADGPPDNNLWVCEHNGGSPRWRQPQSNPNSQALATADQGHFWLGSPVSDTDAGGFQPLQPRCWEFTNSFATVRLTKASAVVATGDGAGYATIGIYDAANTLLGQSNTIQTNAGVASFDFTPALNLSNPVYTACLATTSATALYKAAQSSAAILLLGSPVAPRFFIPGNVATGANPIVMPTTLGSRTGITMGGQYPPGILGLP